MIHTYLCRYRLTMNLAYRWTAIVTLAVFLFSHTMLFAKSEKCLFFRKIKINCYNIIRTETMKEFVRGGVTAVALLVCPLAAFYSNDSNVGRFSFFPHNAFR